MTTKRSVVFDVNAYRCLVKGCDCSNYRPVFDKLLARERVKGIAGLAASPTIHELIVHLVDPEDPHHDECLVALSALVHHVSQGGDERHFPVLGDYEMLLSKLLFRQADTQLDQGLQAVCSLAWAVYEAAPKLDDLDLQRDLIQLACLTDSAKQQWVERMRCLLMLFGADANSPYKIAESERTRLIDKFGWEKMLAGSLVWKIASNLGVSFKNEEEVYEYADRAATTFPVAFKLLHHLWQKFQAKDGYTLEHHKENRENLIYDIFLSFSVHTGQIEGEEEASTLLITDDKAIHRAAEDSGYSERFMSLRDYLKFVGFEPAEVNCEG